MSTTSVLFNPALILAFVTEKLFQRDDFNHVFYTDAKYNILVLTHLPINLKETERMKVSKIPPTPILWYGCEPTNLVR